jgi:hypothetical protein
MGVVSHDRGGWGEGESVQVDVHANVYGDRSRGMYLIFDVPESDLVISTLHSVGLGGGTHSSVEIQIIHE